MSGLISHSRWRCRLIVSGSCPRPKILRPVPVHSEDGKRGQRVLRWVGSNGAVSVDNQMFSVSNAFRGELVDAFADDTTIHVCTRTT